MGWWDTQRASDYRALSPTGTTPNLRMRKKRPHRYAAYVARMKVHPVFDDPPPSDTQWKLRDQEQRERDLRIEALLKIIT